MELRGILTTPTSAFILAGFFWEMVSGCSKPCPFSLSILAYVCTSHDVAIQCDTLQRRRHPVSVVGDDGYSPTPVRTLALYRLSFPSSARRLAQGKKVERADDASY